MARIGFVGLGNMGGPMAANLVKAGHRVIGYDMVAAAREAAAAKGVAIAVSAADAARGTEAVITMLPSGQIVRAIYEEPGGILQSTAPGTLFVECSTIDVASARAAHELAHAAGMDSVDAPVSGGVGGAVAATLTFMAGGSQAAFARAQPILAAMGKKIVHCGDAGAGQAAKICNNMILGISMIAVSEAFALADRLGLSRQALFDVASTASGQCWSLTSYCPVPGPVPVSPANNGYKPGFAAALMLKDLRLSQEAARETGAATELGEHATRLYEKFAASGHEGEDFSAIFRAIAAGGVQ
ncbi:3-hydroxyisobutyrate dehydrogenase [Acidiphilium sp. AL]|uniref:3-hydroxyisobutyrate dehydrogenase n=1 Tax=Acidiphilium iwatense TaxID=768198 RepID=A0ABS9DZE2_9PROT|nr:MULTISPECIES: 3-hydroxyisobutyrate dehydrogenase [Acidiphilium]MCF3946797.1 3-hydroxyisobutyrate dehydrogenase [Acidiphilium iwatense]MCU4159049.1 3-hydroxyisobutyrate dehydrogenase [Acidiphilium sp. AL]